MPVGLENIYMNVEIDNCRWRCHKLASTNNLNNCSLLASASCHQQLCRTSHSISCFGLYVLYSVKRFFFLFLNQNLYEKKRNWRGLVQLIHTMRHKMINIYWHVPLSSELNFRSRSMKFRLRLQKPRSFGASELHIVIWGLILKVFKFPL